jgi:hypothetical protein
MSSPYVANYTNIDTAALKTGSRKLVKPPKLWKTHQSQTKQTLKSVEKSLGNNSTQLAIIELEG